MHIHFSDILDSFEIVFINWIEKKKKKKSKHGRTYERDKNGISGIDPNMISILNNTKEP